MIEFELISRVGYVCWAIGFLSIEFEKNPAPGFLFLAMGFALIKAGG